MRTPGLAAALLLLSATAARGLSPAPDPGFGSGGIVTTDVLGGGEAGRDGLVLPDGRIVICGSAADAGGGSFLLLLRYLADGTLDDNFGVHGIVTTGFGGTSTEATCMARLADGRLVVAGSFVSGSTHLSVVARYDSSGALDPTFGTGGKVTQSIGPVGDIQSLAIQPDGRIVIAGSFRVSGTITFMGLRRYLQAGAIDSTFGINGTVTRGPGVDNGCAAIALQPDGKIVGVGTTKLTAGSGYEFLTFRFKANGSPDSTFATVGRATTAVSPFLSFARDVEILPGGRILVAGYAGTAADLSHKYVVARFLSNGTLDPAFNGTGIVLTPEVGQTGGFAAVNDMLLLNSGQMLLSGQATNPGTSDDYELVRMDSTGTMDASFNGSGMAFTDLAGGGRDVAHRVLRQPDGKLIAVGSAGGFVFTGGTRVGLVRYLADAFTADVTAAPRPGCELGPFAPNPLSTHTRFSFRLASAGEASLRIYDVTGREVVTLAAGTMAAGEHSLAWTANDANGTPVRDGIYFCRLLLAPGGGAPASSAIRKLIVLR